MRRVGREKPLEASQIKVGVFPAWCFIHGKKGAVLASLTRLQPQRSRVRRWKMRWEGRRMNHSLTTPSSPSCALHTRAGTMTPPSLDLHSQKPQGWHYQGRGRKGHFPSPQDSLLPCTIPARLPHAFISLLPPHSQGYLRISEMKSSDAPGLSASFSLGLRTDS